MKNETLRTSPQGLSCAFGTGRRVIRARRLRAAGQLGVVAGIRSLLNLGGTGHASLLQSAFTTPKRIPGFEADVQNIRGDFDVAIGRVRQEQPQTGIEG